MFLRFLRFLSCVLLNINIYVLLIIPVSLKIFSVNVVCDLVELHLPILVQTDDYLRANCRHFHTLTCNKGKVMSLAEK